MTTDHGDADVTVAVSVCRTGARIRFILSTFAAEFVVATLIAAHLNTVEPFDVIELLLLLFKTHNPHSLYYVA